MEKFKIEIESDGDYSSKKEFTLQVNMTPEQFLELAQAVLDHLKVKKIEMYTKPVTKAS